MIRFQTAPFFMLILFVACSTPIPKAPDVVVVEKEVEKIVQVRCEDKRAAAPAIQTDDDFAAVDPEDPIAIWTLSQMYRATVTLLRSRLLDADAQIKACSGLVSGGRK